MLTRRLGRARYWRKLTWVLVAWAGFCASGLVVQWVDGINGDGYQACVDYGFDSASCKEDFSYGPGPTVIILIWLLVSFILSGLWLLTRPSRRRCPACDTEIRAGEAVCSTCEDDPQWAGRLVTVMLMAASFATLAIIYSQTYAVDAGSCRSDVLTTDLAEWVFFVGGAYIAGLSYAFILVGVPGRLRRSHWRYALGVPVALSAVVALFFVSVFIPILGLLPGLDCKT